MSKTVLVTGAAGMIGAHVAGVLHRGGYRVVAVDDLSGGFTENLEPGWEFHQLSVVDHASLDRLVQEIRPEVIYHLAAYAAEGLSHFIRRFNVTNNIVGSVNVINAAINFGVRRVVFTSSAAVFGHAPEPLTEETFPHPADPYGVAKYAVEQELAVAHDMFGLEFAVLRPHNVYGPKQNIGDRYRNVVGIFMNQAMQGKPLSVFGDGLQTRQFTYIDEVAEVIAGAGWSEAFRNQVVNVGSDVPVTVLRLAELVQEALGVSAEIQHLAPRLEAAHVNPSHAKLHRLWPQWRATPLEEGVREMAVWARQVGPRAPSVFEGIEIERNLPPSWNIARRGDA